MPTGSTLAFGHPSDTSPEGASRHMGTEQPLSMTPAHTQHHMPVLLLLEAGEPQPHGLQRCF